MALRAFVACELDSALNERLAGLISELRPRLPRLRWVRPEGIHLTLRFLGSSPPDALVRLAPLLRRSAAECPPFDLGLAGLGVFPERGAPRVLWLGLALPSAALELQRRCEESAVEAGFAPEGRSFRPHLTLGRWRERERRPQLPSLEATATRCESVTLFSSELRRDGAVYRAIESFPLGAAAAQKT